MYCDQAGFIARFGIEEIERHAWDETADAADEARIAQALTDASNEIDAFINGRVSLPIATEHVPEILKQVCANIARYNLQDDAPLEEVKERYLAASKYLNQVAMGKVMLVVAGTEQVAHIEASRGESDRIFTRETLSGF